MPAWSVEVIQEQLDRYLITVCRLFPAITPMNVRDLRIREWVACCEYVEEEVGRG